jgi:hypothetical protein
LPRHIPADVVDFAETLEKGLHRMPSKRNRLDACRLVVIDEIRAKTNMTSTSGRSFKADVELLVRTLCPGDIAVLAIAIPSRQCDKTGHNRQ